MKINRDTPLFIPKKTRVQCLQKFSQENNQSCKKILFFNAIPKKIKKMEKNMGNSRYCSA